MSIHGRDFDRAQKQYDNMSDETNKPEEEMVCPDCDGTGETYHESVDEYLSCLRCKGTGYVKKD